MSLHFADMRPSAEDIRAAMKKKAVRKKPTIMIDDEQPAPKRPKTTGAIPSGILLPAGAGEPGKTLPTAALIALPALQPAVETAPVESRGAAPPGSVPEGAEPEAMAGGETEAEEVSSTGEPVQVRCPEGQEAVPEGGAASRLSTDAETRRSEIPLPEGFDGEASGLGDTVVARRLFRRILLPADRILFDALSVEEAAGQVWPGFLQVKEKRNQVLALLLVRWSLLITLAHFVGGSRHGHLGRWLLETE